MRYSTQLSPGWPTLTDPSAEPASEHLHGEDVLGRAAPGKALAVQPFALQPSPRRCSAWPKRRLYAPCLRIGRIHPNHEDLAYVIPRESGCLAFFAMTW